MGKTAIIIGLADTTVLLAGIGIFAIVFGQGLDPAAGPGLIFITTYAVNAERRVLAPLFFLLVYFAALTSGLSLLEVTTRWAENRFGLTRQKHSALC